MEKKGLTLSGITLPSIIFALLSVAMIGVSIYLTDHYYETIYPTTIGGAKSLCDVSSFFNCDAATYSSIAAFAGVPISFFGIMMGLYFLVAAFMPSEKNEQTASALAKYNFIGCVVLFIFSLAVLGSLCPFCTGYYVLSGIVAGLFWKFGSKSWVPDTKVAGLWVVAVLVGAVIFNQVTASKQEKQDNLAGQVVQQFNQLANYGDPEVESPFKLHMAKPNFAEAPVRVTIFSDFQCPFCQRVADQMHQLTRLYGNKLNVQYMFYPLDSSCNAKMKSQVHPYACRAAMLAACDASKFAKVHDEIFAAQESLSLETLQKIAKNNDLTACFEGQTTKDAVIASMNNAAKYNLTSTPTIIINGRKIEGSIPNPQFQAIFDSLAK